MLVWRPARFRVWRVHTKYNLRAPETQSAFHKRFRLVSVGGTRSRSAVLNQRAQKQIAAAGRVPLPPHSRRGLPSWPRTRIVDAMPRTADTLDKQAVHVVTEPIDVCFVYLLPDSPLSRLLLESLVDHSLLYLVRSGAREPHTGPRQPEGVTREDYRCGSPIIPTCRWSEFIYRSANFTVASRDATLKRLQLLPPSTAARCSAPAGTPAAVASRPRPWRGRRRSGLCG